MAERFLLWLGNCLNGEGGRGVTVDLVVGLPVLGERPTTMAALLLTLAFGRKVGSEVTEEGGRGCLALNGDEGREEGLDWTTSTLLKLTLAVTLTDCESVTLSVILYLPFLCPWMKRSLKLERAER